MKLRLFRRNTDNESGAVLILTAASLALIMSSVALTVDVGKQVTEKRKLQTYADQASSDALAGLGKSSSVADSTALVVSSLARNGFTAGGPNSYTVNFGHWTNGAWLPFNPALDDPILLNAIRVCLTSVVHHDFIPSDQTITNCATAIKSLRTQLDVGTFMARATVGATEANLLNAILGPMIGSHQALTIDALSYQGLGAEQLTFGDLTAAGGFATPTDLLNQNMALKDWFTLVATALNGKGTPSDIALASKVADIASHTDSSIQFQPKKWIKFDSGQGSGSAANLSLSQAKWAARDLIFYAADVALANGVNLVQANVPLGVPGVSATTMTMSFIQAPQTYIGDGTPLQPPGTPHVSTGQVRVLLENVLTPAIPGLAGANAKLPVYLEGAGADSTITNITCAEPVDTSPVTVLTNSHAALIRVGQPVTPSQMSDPNANLTMNFTSDILSFSGTVGLLPVNVTVGQFAEKSIGGSSKTYVFNTSPLSTRKDSFGATNLGIGTDLVPQINPTVTISGAGGVSLDAGVIKASIKASINQTLGGIDFLYQQLSGGLGLDVGGADVFNDKLLLCDVPRLVQ